MVGTLALAWTYIILAGDGHVGPQSLGCMELVGAGHVAGNGGVHSS